MQVVDAKGLKRRRKLSDVFYHMAAKWHKWSNDNDNTHERWVSQSVKHLSLWCLSEVAMVPCAKASWSPELGQALLVQLHFTEHNCPKEKVNDFLFKPLSRRKRCLKRTLFPDVLVLQFSSREGPNLNRLFEPFISCPRSYRPRSCLV